MAPSWPKMAPKLGKIMEDGRSIWKEGAQELPEGRQDGPRRPQGRQDGPKMAPKRAQVGPKMAQDGAKTASWRSR